MCLERPKSISFNCGISLSVLDEFGLADIYIEKRGKRDKERREELDLT